jgi:thioredoxin-like negative regulator of GroEL
MGGFAALAFSRELKADRVLAVAPQIMLNQKATGGFDDRWRPIWDDIIVKGRSLRLDARDGLNPEARIYVIYDPYVPEDRGHMRFLDRIPNVTLLAYPFSDHEVLTTLRELKLWNSILDAIFSDNPSSQFDDIRRSYMATRRQSSRYYHALGRPFFRRQRYDVAQRLFERAVHRDSTFAQAQACLQICQEQLQLRNVDYAKQCAEQSPRVVSKVFHAGQLLIQEDRLEEAAAFYHAFAIAHPDIIEYKIYLADAKLRLSQHALQSATDLFLQATRVWPDRLDCQIALADALLRNFEFERVRDIYRTLPEDASRDPSVQGFQDKLERIIESMNRSVQPLLVVPHAHSRNGTEAVRTDVSAP